MASLEYRNYQDAAFEYYHEREGIAVCVGAFDTKATRGLDGTASGIEQGIARITNCNVTLDHSLLGMAGKANSASAGISANITQSFSRCHEKQETPELGILVIEERMRTVGGGWR